MGIKESLYWLWKISDGFRFRIFINSIIGILYVGVSLLFVWISKSLIDIATKQSDGNFTYFIVFMLICVLLQLTLSPTDSKLTVDNEIKLRCQLRYNLFTRLMESRWTGREALHSGDILNRLEKDVQTVTDMLTSIIPSIFVTTLQFLGAFFFLCKLDLRLAIVLIFIMPIALFLSKRYMYTMRKLTKEVRTTESKVDRKSVV